MTKPVAVLDALKRRQPEWTPWLQVIEVVLLEASDSAWDVAVPLRGGLGGPKIAGIPASEGPASPKLGANSASEGEVLLANAEVMLDPELVRRTWTRLATTAAASGSPAMASFDQALHIELDLAALFAASLTDHREHVR